MDILAVILLAVTAFAVVFIYFALRALLIELRRLERSITRLLEAAALREIG